MKKIFFCIALFWVGTLFSQNKKLSMNDAVLGLFTDLKVENLRGVNWIPDKTAYTQIVSTEKGDALLSINVPDMKTDTLVWASDFNGMNNIPFLNWINPEEAWYRQGNKRMLWNAKTNSHSLMAEIPAEAEDQFFDGTTRSFAYVLDNDLYWANSTGEAKRITSDGSYEILNGKSVHRDEFGIDRGIFFSPKGNKLMFYRMDQSMVEDYPIVDWSEVPAVNKNIKYPFAGRTSHEVTLGIYEPKTQKTVFVDAGSPVDTFFTSVTWSPDEQSIYIGILNRDQNHLILNEYNAQTGKYVKTLFEEKDNKYVEPQHPLYFLPDGKEFLWWSQRDGYMHLYRYTKDGKLLNAVTAGPWVVNDIVGINEKKNEVLVTGTKDGAMERHLYKVNWKTGKTERVDATPGVHSFKADSSGNFVIDTWSNEATPRVVDVLSTDKKFKKNLLTAENPLSDYAMPKVENVTLKAADGKTDLYGKLIYPTDFDATKKYPVIVYLYNGPHAQLNLNRFPASGNLWYDYLAQNGYVVWVMDGRGSANRGLEFEQSIFRNLGEVEMADQMKGVEYLKALPFVDGERMGIHGWSYGGFMTTAFMLFEPEVFKAGVAGGPVLDWSMYEIMYGERYMDRPQTNPKGYVDNRLMDKSELLKGKLLLIHGAQDDVVLWQHSMNFLRDAVSKGVQVDYFVYPGHPHNVRGADRVHLMQKVTDYFDLYLK